MAALHCNLGFLETLIGLSQIFKLLRLFKLPFSSSLVSPLISSKLPVVDSQFVTYFTKFLNLMNHRSNMLSTISRGPLR